MYEGDSPETGKRRGLAQSGIGFLLAPHVYADVLENRLRLNGLTMVKRVPLHEGAASEAVSLVTRDSLATRDGADIWVPTFSWWGEKDSDDPSRRGDIHWQRTGSMWRVLSDPWMLLMLSELERKQAAMLSELERGQAAMLSKLKASALVSEVEDRVEDRVEASDAGRRWEIGRDPAAVGKAAVYGLHTLERLRLVELFLLRDWEEKYGREHKEKEDGVKIGERELEQLKGLPKRSRNQSVGGKLVVGGELLGDFLAKLSLETNRHG